MRKIDLFNKCYCDNWISVYKKRNLDLYFTLYVKITLITELKVKAKTTNFCNSEIGKDFMKIQKHKP